MEKREAIKPVIRASSAKMFGFQGIILEETGLSIFHIV
jgi:hypothetical protein